MLSIYETRKPYGPDQPFVGCFRDEKNDRALSRMTSSHDMTPSVSCVVMLRSVMFHRVCMLYQGLGQVMCFFS